MNQNTPSLANLYLYGDTTPFEIADENQRADLALSAEDSFVTDTDVQDLIATMYGTESRPQPTGTSAVQGFDMTSWLSGLKQTGMAQMRQGALFNTIASAGDLFNQLINFDSTRKNISAQANNAKQALQNQENALDNQVLYLKNQLMDRFNKTVATNTMVLAAKNLRVSGASVMEMSKDLAVDTTEDMRMAESNTTLKKISLDAEKGMVDLKAKQARQNQVQGLINSGIKLGLNVATGGGTGMSWGQLF